MAKAFLLILILSVLHTLSGCVGSTYIEDTPQLQQTIPESWEHADQGLKDRVEQNVSTFWHEYGDPLLIELQEKLQKNNPDLNIALKRLQLVKVQLRTVQADFFPELALGGKVNREAQSKRDFKTSQFEGESLSGKRVAYRFIAPLSVSYEPDIWGRISDRELGLKNEFLASEADVRAIKLIQEGLLAENYLYWLFAQEEIVHLDQISSFLEKIHAILIKQKNAGLISADGPLQIRQSIQDLEKRLTERQADSDVLRYNIAVLIGEAPQHFQLSQRNSSSQQLITPVISPDLPLRVLLSRPDIIAQEYRLSAAGARLSEARKAFLPTLSLTAEYGFSSSALSKLLRADALAWDIGADLIGVIFDGGRRTAQIDLAEADQTLLLEEYRKTVLHALFEVESALVKRQAITDQIDTQKQRMITLEEEISLAEARLQKGLTDKTETLLLEQKLEEQRLLQKTLLMASSLNAVTLYMSLGGGESRLSSISQEDLAMQK